MPSLIQGRIVYANVPVPDPQGKNPKSNRPFVVITHDDDIKGQRRVQCVAITDELHLSPDGHYYPLHANQGHGCKSGSAVLCTWIVDLDQKDIDVKKECLKPKVVYQIIEKIRLLKAGAFHSRAPGEPKPPS